MPGRQRQNCWGCGWHGMGLDLWMGTRPCPFCGQLPDGHLPRGGAGFRDSDGWGTGYTVALKCGNYLGKQFSSPSMK